MTLGNNAVCLDDQNNRPLSPKKNSRRIKKYKLQNLQQTQFLKLIDTSAKYSLPNLPNSQIPLVQPLASITKANDIRTNNSSTTIVLDTTSRAPSTPPVLAANIGKLRFLINGRYVVTETIVVNEECIIQPKTILTVNRFENNIPVLRWMAFDLKKFMEVHANDEISAKLANIS